MNHGKVNHSPHGRVWLQAFLCVLLVSSTASAIEQVNTTRSGGLAIHGHDPVAYFTDSAAVEGKKIYSYEWEGATWLFASAANRDLFAAEPERYAPQYGGYCAYAVSRGATAGIDPEAWTIVDNKLYLNNGKRVRELWSEDIPGNIARADTNWPQLLEQD